MTILELTAHYDSRASFYGKARIIETPDHYILISYTTEILKLHKRTGKIEWLCLSASAFSLTTCRHINEFLRQFADAPRGYSKKELLKMAGII